MLINMIYIGQRQRFNVIYVISELVLDMHTASGAWPRIMQCGPDFKILVYIFRFID